MTNREKFKVLADQIKISNQLEQDILEQGEPYSYRCFK